MPTTTHGIKSLLALAIMATLLTGGCKDTPSAAELKFEIERQLPGAHLERESHVHLGRVAMSLAKKIVRWAADEDEDDLRMIRHIRRVCVATYRVHSLPAEGLDTRRLEERLARRGWDAVVKQREGNERTWIFTRSDDDGSIGNLYVVALDHDELTVIDLAGRIDRVMADAFADDPDELVELLGP
ncbi:MAG: DUF4252 domain-containing protein [Thermoanaerobaculia bacterium]